MRKNTVRQKFKVYSISIRQYSSVFKWLISDSILRFKVQSILILASGFLGVTSQLGAFAQAVYYARLLEKGEPVNILNHSIDVQSSVPMFIGFAFGVFVSLLLSSWLLYFSRSRINKLRSKYEVFCSNRILFLFGSSLRLWTPKKKKYTDDTTILRIARGDASFCGRVLQIILETVIPCITLVVAVGILIYLRVSLTLLILLLMLISAILQYKVNVEGARMSFMREETIPESTSEKRKILKRLGGISLPISQDEPWLGSHFRTGATRLTIEAAEGRRIATERSKGINNILLAVLFTCVFIVLGTQSILRGGGWSQLIAYILALRYALVNFRAVSAKLTSINRFYPQFRRYFLFIEKANERKTQISNFSEKYIVKPCPAPIVGSLKEYILHEGHCISLVSPVGLSRHTVFPLTECLLCSDQNAIYSVVNSMGFVTSKYGGPSLSIREMLGLPRDYGWRDIEKDFNGSGLAARLKDVLPAYLGDTVTADIWNNVDSGLKLALGLVSVLKHDFKWIMIEEKGFRSIPSSEKELFLRRLSDRITVIVYNDDIVPETADDKEIFAVIDLGKRRIAGLGNRKWLLEKRKFVDKFMKMGVKKRQGTLSTELDEEEGIDIDEF